MARLPVCRVLMHAQTRIELTSRTPLLSRGVVTTGQHRLSAAYYRGGTSRAVIFREEDLPKDRKEWGPMFLGVIGSPDSNGRQLDGMGGGVSSLSKVCVVGKSTHPEGADVDYTFVALGVKNNEVDFSSNCGNMTSAIGPFAVDSGMVERENGDATVRIHNTNTNKLIDATFPVFNGEAVAHGDFIIDGVSGAAARLELAFLNPAGSKTGKLLPTGKSIDEFEGVKATCIDVGNPVCIVNSQDMGVDGTIMPDTIESHPDLLQRLDVIRRQASVAMGLSKDTASAFGSIPKIVMVTPPTTHKILSGETLKEQDIDLVVRAISVGQPHRAVPITVAMAIAAAVSVQGSVVNLVSREARVSEDGITLGHSSGKIVVGANFKEGLLVNATVYRTARRLMDGNVYWK